MPAHALEEKRHQRDFFLGGDVDENLSEDLGMALAVFEPHGTFVGFWDRKVSINRFHIDIIDARQRDSTNNLTFDKEIS
jgi:hypothetical protein